MRYKKWNFKKAVQVCLVPAVLIVSSGTAMAAVSNGMGVYAMDSDYKAALENVDSAKPAYYYDYICQSAVIGTGKSFNSACIINGNLEPSIVLWGDSNAAHYVGVVGAFAKAAGFSFRNVEHSACPPFYGDRQTILSLVAPDWRSDCAKSLPAIYPVIKHYKVVILGAEWASYYEVNQEQFVKLFHHTLDVLSKNHEKVIVLGNIPRFAKIDHRCRKKSLKALVPDCLNAESASHPPKVNRILKKLAGQYSNVDYFDITDVLCEDAVCHHFLNGHNVYFDGGHLSMSGSWAIGDYILNSEGVPSVFSKLRKYGPQTSGRKLAQIKQWQALDLASLHGAEKSASGGASLADSNAKGYVIAWHSLPFGKVAPDTVHAAVAIGDCTGMPLVRLRLTTSAGARSYDLQLDCNSGEYIRNNAGLFNTDVIRTKTGHVFVFSVTPGATVTGGKILIFPGSGTDLSTYSKAGTGSLTVTRMAFSAHDATKHRLTAN